MEGFKRAAHENLIEETIDRKGAGYSEASAKTFRSDASAILEALVAEVDEGSIEATMTRQGFQWSDSYLSTFRALASVARSRRRP